MDERGRIRIPRGIRIDARRVIVIPLGLFYMVIPIPKTTIGLSFEASARELRVRTEGPIRREVRQRLERRGQRSSSNLTCCGHVKSQDWLKTWADAIFNALGKGLLTFNASPNSIG